MANKDSVDAGEFNAMFQMIGHDLNETKINDWFYADKQDRGYSYLNDDEIMELVMNVQTDQPQDMEAEQAVTVPHSVAIKMFDECLKWLEEQEVNVYNMATLRNLRELADNIRLSALTQTQINNFFPSAN